VNALPAPRAVDGLSVVSLPSVSVAFVPGRVDVEAGENRPATSRAFFGDVPADSMNEVGWRTN
jgi:hypothetical protein